MSRKLAEYTTPLPLREPQPESAWERGLRAAKQMKRLADHRKKVDMEYEEKKKSLSLTQIEMDKEHDENIRPATPSPSYCREDYVRPGSYNNFRPDSPSTGYSYTHDPYYVEPA